MKNAIKRFINCECSNKVYIISIVVSLLMLIGNIVLYISDARSVYMLLILFPTFIFARSGSALQYRKFEKETNSRINNAFSNVWQEVECNADIPKFYFPLIKNIKVMARVDDGRCYARTIDENGNVICEEEIVDKKWFSENIIVKDEK